MEEIGIKKVLVANRGEIAIRVFRACVEMGVRTVGIYTYEDRYSLHRYKSDESYQIGEDNDPLKPYLDIASIVRLAKACGADAIHPGYGFLSENAAFAQACSDAGITFIGPQVSVLRALGDKITAKEVAVREEVPVIRSSVRALTDIDIALDEAREISYPVMLKAASGGGGRGMRVIHSEEDLRQSFPEARREALNAFGDDTVFLEKYVQNPKHIEVQIVADSHGNMLHLFERDCSVQRRYQKVIEFAPSFGLPEDTRQRIYDYALRIGRAVEYQNIGTVEFLVDQDGSVYFIEVNPRIQVEHTVTEMVTNIDLVKTQIYVAAGCALSDPRIGLSGQESVRINGFALQCRVTTEDPANNFKPDYGVVTTYRSASGFGIRLDAGSIYQGVRISPFFDSLLVKVSASDQSLEGACRRMRRALAEFRIRGVNTNIPFLDNILRHPTFREGRVTVNFIKDEPALFQIRESRNRASKLLNFLGETIVNGNPDIRTSYRPDHFPKPLIPTADLSSPCPRGTKDLLTELGPEGLARWLKEEKRVHFTDTTFRDAHQSLLATRVRTLDMLKVAPAYARDVPQVFSVELWGGATFDVCLRFLRENPWERLRMLRAAMPNILTQMLIRGSNGVGYKAYPDNLIEKFVALAWENGLDVFRIFDSLNWMESIAPCIDYVRRQTGGIAEGAICYTGDISDPSRTKYTLKYYTQLAKDIENAGAHMLCVKDMAGLLKPMAAFELISALKSELSIPIHLHTHDTSSTQAATYLKAIEAGVDVIDVSLGGLSGLTAQPNFNSMVEMLRFHEREPDFDREKLAAHSDYWESVRAYYFPFESGMKSGSGQVYQHEIPGGQYSNLKGQAIALGLEDKFPEVTRMYTEVNQLFGDIIKVTPSSKVVGDMAQFMISNGLSVEDVLEKGENIDFPDSVKSFFRGDLGQPVGGFPERMQQLVLKDEAPYAGRPGEQLEPIDFDLEFEQFRQRFGQGMGRELEITDLVSWLLYPKVFEDAYEHHLLYGNVLPVPTRSFFYGMQIGEEIMVSIDRGKDLLVQLMIVGEADSNGKVGLFFKVNGQMRYLQIVDKSREVEKVSHRKADSSKTGEIGSPLQGLLSNILVRKGEQVKRNQPLFVIEAMKMETTVTASEPGRVSDIVLPKGTLVSGEDLVLILEGNS